MADQALVLLSPSGTAVWAVWFPDGETAYASQAPYPQALIEEAQNGYQGSPKGNGASWDELIDYLTYRTPVRAWWEAQDIDENETPAQLLIRCQQSLATT